MNIHRIKEVVLELKFGTRDLYDRFVRDVRRRGGLQGNLVRGRISSDRTWVRMEFRGASGKIDDLVAAWKSSIVDPEVAA